MWSLRPLSRVRAKPGRAQHRRVCEHVFVSDERDDPARRPRLVLRVGRAARRPDAARPAGDRRRRRRAGRELRGEGVRRPHGDGRPAGAAALPAGGRRPAAHVGVLGGEQGRLPRCSRTRRRSSRGSRSTRRSSTCAGWSGSPARPVEIAARLKARRPRAGRAADHGRRRPHEVPRQGGERGREAGRAAASSRPRRARVPAPAAGRAAVGRRRGDGARSCARAGSTPSARSPGSRRTTLVRLLGRASGRHLLALAHNRDPRRVRVGRRRGSIGSQRRGRRSPRRARPRRSSASSTASRAGCAGRPRRAARSSYACASTISRAPPVRTRFRTRRSTPRRCSPPRADCSPPRCR